MLTKLIEKFENAEGRSESVIIVVCDIRSFSKFSKNHEAPDIAAFIKKFYSALLKEYFKDAVYAKPTGDGLLILFKYSESNLLSISEHVISNCLKAVKDFAGMFADELMLNFEVPDRIGFSVARGTAFCLYSGEEIIDYSGQSLNLASRLNEFARPQGVVVDGAYLLGAIPENLRSVFHKEEGIFIRGIFETTPTTIYCSEDVEIDDSAKHPISHDDWEKVEAVLSYKSIKNSDASLYTVKLKKEALSPNKVMASVVWPKKGTELLSSIELRKIKYMNDANGPRVLLDYAEMKSLIDNKLTGTTKITLEVQFVPKQELKGPKSKGLG